MMLVFANSAMAGWQYDGYYPNDGYYEDDGSRFIIGFNGGLSFAKSKIKNEMGALQATYFANIDSGLVISATAYDALDETEQSEWTDIGVGDISKLPVKEDFSKLAFAAGAYVGFTVPNHNNWRIQAMYDHISETNYNQNPLFEGDLTLSSGDVVHVYSTGAKSTITTDIVSAMAFYDFYEGASKQSNKFIPYIGLGVGYAVSKTTLKISDIFGDLSGDNDLLNYGKLENNVLVFDNPSDANKYPSSENIAALGAIGFSYGINETTFFDLGARLIYVPKITWSVSNSDGTNHREWFAAENMLYTNIMAGIRFEF